MGQNMMNPALFFASSEGVTFFAISWTIGAAGAIDSTVIASSNTSLPMAGVTLVKTAAKTGRYTITLPKNYRHLLYKGGSFTGPDDTAFPTTTGSQLAWRDIDIGIGANDGTIEVQLLRADTQADAEAAAGSATSPSMVSVLLIVTDRNSP